MAVKRIDNLRVHFTDNNGALASNYRLFFYAAGSSTKQNTYNSSAGTSANSNPITLNARGEPAVEIWGTVGQTYKVGLAVPGTDDPPASFVWTEDNLACINDATVTLNEWVSGPTPTFISGTQFSLVGDQTSTFAVGRRVQCTVSAGTVYGRITASAFTTLTTVTLVLEPSQALDSGLSAVSYALLSTTHPSIPWVSTAADTVSTVASAATVNLDANAKDYAFISGTTTITAITLAQGKECTVEFQGALTLTNGASLVLPGAANITTAAGDTAIFRGEASGVVRCITYQKANALNGKQPTRTVLTTGTALTYTTPLGATRLNVRLVGGGGGGGACNTNNGAVGSNTTFGTLTGSGGAGGSNGGGAGATGGTATGGDINIQGGGGGGGGSSNAAGTFLSGGQGGSSAFGGSGLGGNGNAAGTAAPANSGGGGGGGGATVSANSGAGGGAGGYVEKLITAPAATYSYTVGGGGNGGAAGGTAGGNGGSGLIIVDEFYN